MLCARARVRARASAGARVARCPARFDSVALALRMARALVLTTVWHVHAVGVGSLLVKPSTPIRGWNSFDFGDGSERPYNTPDVPTLLSLVRAVEVNLLPFVSRAALPSSAGILAHASAENAPTFCARRATTTSL